MKVKKLSGLHYVKKSDGSSRVYYRPGRGSRDEAQLRHLWRRLPDDFNPLDLPVDDPLAAEQERHLKEAETYLRERLGYYRSRAAGKGLLCELSLADLVTMFEKQRGRCAVSGISFNLEGARKSARAFAPSVDRIDSSKGYCIGNVRLVCRIVNMALNEWGEKPLDRLVSAMAGRRRYGSPEVQMIVSPTEGDLL